MEVVMSERKLVELAFFVEDVEATAAFYEKFLGKKPVAEGEGMAIFMLGEVKLFLHRTYEPEEGELPPENHMAFGVEDVDGVVDELKEAGIEIEEEAKDYYWGRSAYLRAPDGTLIELNKVGE